MITLKQSLLATFVATGAVILGTAGLMAWLGFSHLIDRHETFFKRQASIVDGQQISNALDTVTLFFNHQIDELEDFANALVRRPNLIAYVEKSQQAPLVEILQRTVPAHDLDFALVLDRDGYLLTSYPQPDGGLPTGDRIRASHFLDLIEGLREGREGATSMTEKGLIKVRPGHARILSLPIEPDFLDSAVATVAARAFGNDFGEPLGVLVLGKLVDNRHDDLRGLHDSLGIDVAVYAGERAIAWFGFPDAPPALDTRQSGGAMTGRLSTTVYVEGDPFAHRISCDPAADVSGNPVALICAGLSTERTEAFLAEMEAFSDGILIEVYAWTIILTVAGTLVLLVLSIVFASRVARPLKRMEEAVLRIAEGDAEGAPLPTSRIVEIRTISEALDVFRENAAQQQDD